MTDEQIVDGIQKAWDSWSSVIVPLDPSADVKKILEATLVFATAIGGLLDERERGWKRRFTHGG